MTESVVGIGGVFFRARDPEALKRWYGEHLGIELEDYAMLAQLRAAGIDVDEHLEEHEYGRFAWATDPEGNRFELWEPPQ